jgi:hypothetical protein
MSARDPRIQRAERLVEQQDPRLAEGRLRDGEPLLHAARELRRVAVPGSGKPHASRMLSARTMASRRRAPNSIPRIAGFVCESYATATASDITALGSWRRHLDAEAAQSTLALRHATCAITDER